MIPPKPIFPHLSHSLFSLHPLQLSLGGKGRQNIELFLKEMCQQSNSWFPLLSSPAIAFLWRISLQSSLVLHLFF
jgi:hypothetical protein